MVIFYLSPINDHSRLQGHITQLHSLLISVWRRRKRRKRDQKWPYLGFLPKSFALLVANTSITLNTIHYKHKRLYTKKNSYLMSRISFFIIPDKIHIAHLFSSTFDNQSNNVPSTISRTFANNMSGPSLRFNQCLWIRLIK